MERITFKKLRFTATLNHWDTLGNKEQELNYMKKHVASSLAHEVENYIKLNVEEDHTRMLTYVVGEVLVDDGTDGRPPPRYTPPPTKIIEKYLKPEENFSNPYAPPQVSMPVIPKNISPNITATIDNRVGESAEKLQNLRSQLETGGDWLNRNDIKKISEILDEVLKILDK